MAEQRDLTDDANVVEQTDGCSSDDEQTHGANAGKHMLL